MKKKMIVLFPLIIMPVLIPIYNVLDNLFLVNIFGCGCVPSVQTNILNIPFNANNLRFTVFSLLTVVLSIWSIVISRKFNKKMVKIIYPVSVVFFNMLLALWTIKAFMWS